MNEKSVADMSRAKALKGLFRMTTPYLTMRDIPLIAVNHTYQEIGLFGRAIVSGGRGIYYLSDSIWFIGRQQEKKGTEIVGYNFVMNVEKSRCVREKSKIPIAVTWEGGIETYSGLLDVAIEGGYVVKPTIGWYSKVDKVTGEIEDKKVRIAETLKESFWKPIFKDTDFKEYLISKYEVGHADMIKTYIEEDV